MTGRLTQGMYAEGNELFGIHNDQIRGYDFVHNGGWYNQKGEKLGWGDLSIDDIETISLELKEGEAFVVLSERSSSWNFILSPEIDVPVDAPGVDYIAKHAMLVILPCKVIQFNDYTEEQDVSNTKIIGRNHVTGAPLTAVTIARSGAWIVLDTLITA